MRNSLPIAGCGIAHGNSDRTGHGWLPIVLAAIGIAYCCLCPAQANERIENAAVQGHVLGRFKDRFGFERIYAKLPPGLSTKQLVIISRQWHRSEPNGWFWFLDDDGKAGQLLASLPETERGDLSNYPLDWVKAHSLGHIQMELLSGGGRRWVLMPGFERSGDPLAVLDKNGSP
jgi:hypothetical protein